MIVKKHDDGFALFKYEMRANLNANASKDKISVTFDFMC